MYLFLCINTLLPFEKYNFRILLRDYQQYRPNDIKSCANHITCNHKRQYTSLYYYLLWYLRVFALYHQNQSRAVARPFVRLIY